MALQKRFDDSRKQFEDLIGAIPAILPIASLNAIHSSRENATASSKLIGQFC
jgi:hypothetical protein